VTVDDLRWLYLTALRDPSLWRWAQESAGTASHETVVKIAEAGAWAVALQVAAVFYPKPSEAQMSA